MKYLISLSVLLLMFSCAPEEDKDENQADASPLAERSIGFLTAFEDSKWYLGTEEAINVVKELDKVWAARNFEAMKPYLSDTAKFWFDDGRIANSPDEFIAMLQEDDEESVGIWTFDYVFSVDINPETGGEHVQAGFTGTAPNEEGVEVQTKYHESYYIIQGKIVWWNQYTQKVKNNEEETEETD